MNMPKTNAVRAASKWLDKLDDDTLSRVMRGDC
jgi:hypothetical protein